MSWRWIRFELKKLRKKRKTTTREEQNGGWLGFSDPGEDNQERVGWQK